MEIAMSNNRPETVDGWTDGYTYAYKGMDTGVNHGYFVTAWTTPILVEGPCKLKIEGCNKDIRGEAKFLDVDGSVVNRCDVYPREVDMPVSFCSFVFCMSIEDKRTIKITDMTHGKVLFSNGLPWTETKGEEK